jgi:3-oxoacyl-[acyl-carrier-protein] synthase-3
MSEAHTASRPGAGPANVQSTLGVRLAGTGMAVPQRVATNADLADKVDTSDEWIVQRTGIRQRRLADDKTGVRELATDAVRQALDNAGVAPAELDMLLCATLTPEMCTPSTAARVVANLGAAPAGAVDLSAACSGFVYGMNMASALIQTGMYRNVAVVGVEVLSRLINWDDRRTCILFGDGAGAAIFSADRDNPGRGCLHQTMSSDGSRWHQLYCPQREQDLPVNGEVAGHTADFTGKLNTLQMNGREIYKFAVSTMEQMIDRVLAENGLKPDDLAMVVSHQSNGRILESARKRLGLPDDKLYINIDRYGNTSAASVPICLHELTEAKRLHEGDLVLFIALGGGLTWATSLWRL